MFVVIDCKEKQQQQKKTVIALEKYKKMKSNTNEWKISKYDFVEETSFQNLKFLIAYNCWIENRWKFNKDFVENAFQNRQPILCCKLFVVITQTEIIFYLFYFSVSLGIFHLIFFLLLL